MDYLICDNSDNAFLTRDKEYPLLEKVWGEEEGAWIEKVKEYVYTTIDDKGQRFTDRAWRFREKRESSEDRIDRKLGDAVKKDKEYQPKYKGRDLDNGNRFFYHWEYKQYVLRNRFGSLLRTFNRDTIDKMTEDEFIELLTECSKDNR